MKNCRVDKSREELVKAFFFALGSYMEQEATKEDSWKDMNIGQLYDHLRHEVEVEIKRNLKPPKDQLSYLLHNCVDAVNLSVILLAKVMGLANLKESNRKEELK